VLPYSGADRDQLTIGGEMDKLASNIGIGRAHAAVHWRYDYADSLPLGEAVAIAIAEGYGQLLERIVRGLFLHEVQWQANHGRRQEFLMGTPNGVRRRLLEASMFSDVNFNRAESQLSVRNGSVKRIHDYGVEFRPGERP